MGARGIDPPAPIIFSLDRESKCGYDADTKHYYLFNYFAKEETAVTRSEQEQLLAENELFILHTAQKTVGRRITRSDDEWSIALSAFWEAVQHYDPQKGSIQSYASVVIRHRLIDEARNRKKREQELSVEPAAFTGEAEEVSIGVQRAVERNLIQEAPDTTLADEIEELAELLRRYHIDFFDLPKCCPKARKTRSVCLKAARFVCRIAELLARLRKTLKLPSSEMETGVPISRKLLEQFRKYIITTIEIEAGDFPGLQGYFVREGAE